jgi:polyvinyl alcohol dehydrogenase (cytochrome)
MICHEASNDPHWREKMSTSRPSGMLLPALAAIFLSSAPLHAQTPGFGVDGDFDELGVPWPFSGGNIHNTRTALFADPELNPQTVAGLSVKWVFTTAGDVSATPTVEGRALYMPDWGGMLWKLDTETGAVIWSHKVSDYTGNPKSFSRTSPAIAGRAIIFGDQAGATVMAVDKVTGRLLWKRVVDPLPSAWITGAPVVFGDRVYVGVASNEEALAASVPGFQVSFRGRAVSLDLATGAVRWEFSTVPEGYTGGAVVGGNLVIDEKRRSLYFGSGNNYSVPQAAAICLFASSTVDEDRACLDPANYEDSILAVDLFDGHLKWVFHTLGFDVFTGNCLIGSPLCPKPAGPDFDFASAPNLFTVLRDSDSDDDLDLGGAREQDMLGVGQKSGVYWALNPDDGSLIWSRVVGPGGELGGIEWDSAVDGKRIYVAESDLFHLPYSLGGPTGPVTRGGSWAALDPATGALLWQVPSVGNDPAHPKAGALAISAMSSANGVVFAGTNSGDMVALDGATGKVLWDFKSGGSVIGGPAIVGDSLYWGSGYSSPLMGHISNNRLYAFTLPGRR